MPSVLFLPDRDYDHRIWADVPSGLGAEVTLYDLHEPMPWTGPRYADFLASVGRLAPGGRFDVVVGAGEAAGLVLGVGSAGLARGALFFQPQPDRWLDDFEPPERSRSELAGAADWMVPVMDALNETQPERRRSMVVGAWRDQYGPHLAAADLDLVCRVIGDHAEDVLATVKEVTELFRTGRIVHSLAPPWVDRLAEARVPVTIVSSRRAVFIGEALVGRALDGELVTAGAETNLLWLEDRDTAVTAIGRMLARAR